MADLAKQPTTGFVNNGNFVQFGSNNIADEWDLTVLSKSNRPLLVFIKGEQSHR